MRVAAQYDDEEADARAARVRRVARDHVQRGAAARARLGAAPPPRGRDQRARGVRPRLRAPPVGAAARDAPRGRAHRGARPRRDLEDARAARLPRSSTSSKERRPLDRRRPRGGPAARGARHAPRRLRARRVRRGRRTGSRTRPDGARHLPLAAQARGARRRFARAPGVARGGARARCSGAWSTRRAARRSARSTTSRWLGPFAAWWALVIDRPAMLVKLATALPMMAHSALLECCEHAEALRAAISPESLDGAVGRRRAAGARVAARRGHRARTRARGARPGARATSPARPARSRTSRRCASSWWSPASGSHGALSDPVKALHPATMASAEDSLSQGGDRERAARGGARRPRHPRPRAVDARRLARVARPAGVRAARGRGARRDPEDAASAAEAEEEGAEAHRGRTSS